MSVVIRSNCLLELLPTIKPITYLNYNVQMQTLTKFSISDCQSFTLSQLSLVCLSVQKPADRYKITTATEFQSFSQLTESLHYIMFINHFKWAMWP